MKTNEKRTGSFWKTAVAMALAGALSVGAAAPALAMAEETVPDGGQVAAQGDAAADESGFEESDEGAFGADATEYLSAPGGADANGVDANGTDANGYGWWYRRVTPWQALSATQGYFGVWNFDDWDYKTGFFRSIPAYRVEIDVDGGWNPYSPYSPYSPWRYGRTRYVAFVNYFTGAVITGYVDYE